MDPRCVSCGRRVEGDTHYVMFSCPGCGKHQIVRCNICKERANPYTCPACKFAGP